MEASMDKTAEAPQEAIGPTAKQMAEMEELNQARAVKLAAQQNKRPEEPQVNVIEVASRGYDALQEAFAKHNAKKPPEYTPPPRTERQMSALEEELAAGARAVERARAQQIAARPAPVDGHKEGFTTPVYRPNDVVPDPTIAAHSGFVAGNRKFGTDA